MGRFRLTDEKINFPEIYWFIFLIINIILYLLGKFMQRDFKILFIVIDITLIIVYIIVSLIKWKKELNELENHKMTDEEVKALKEIIDNIEPVEDERKAAIKKFFD
jgi:hypothetical protein